MANRLAKPPTDDELAALLRVLFSGEDSPSSRHAALRLYLFLPVTDGGIKHRSSLEALLRDARGAGGRNVYTGKVELPDHSPLWLSAMGYLALVDQMGALLVVSASPDEPKGTTPFERLLLWDGDVLSDEAAAIYALRCSVEHSYGLLNDPRDRVRKPERVRALPHMFALTADGGDLVRLGDRTFPLDVSLSDVPETIIDLRALTDAIERLIANLRSEHMRDGGLTIRPDVPLAALMRGCFFQHCDSITASPG